MIERLLQRAGIFDKDGYPCGNPNHARTCRKGCMGPMTAAQRAGLLRYVLTMGAISIMGIVGDMPGLLLGTVGAIALGKIYPIDRPARVEEARRPRAAGRPVELRQ